MSKDLYSYNPDTGNISHGNKEVRTTSAIAKAFGYMAIALAVTAVASLITCLIFANVLGDKTGEAADQVVIAYLAALIGAGIVMLVLSFVMAFMSRSSKHSILVPFMLYAVCMGIVFSAFMLMGIDFYVVAEAFGITSAVFAIMALIGYFSKINLNIFAWVGIALLLMAFGGGLFFLILYLVSGANWAADGYILSNLIVYVVITVLAVIMIAVDVYNIKRILTKGQHSRNLILYCAYIMYCDFIYLLIRVILLLASTKRD